MNLNIYHSELYDKTASNKIKLQKTSDSGILLYVILFISSIMGLIIINISRKNNIN